MANAGSKSITKQVTDKAGFAINYLQCSFGTTWNTVAASSTSFFIYGDNLSFHRLFLLFLWFQSRTLKIPKQLADGDLFKLALHNLLNTHDFMA